MKKLLNIFRNNLKTQTANDLLPSNWATVVRKFFQSQGINLEQFSLDDLDDVLMLQSVFNQKSLGQVDATTKNNLILWQLGQFLVAQSYLSENPVTTVIPASPEQSRRAKAGIYYGVTSSAYLNRFQVKPSPASPDQDLPGMTKEKRLNFRIFRPALALMAVIFISLFILKTQSKSPSENIEISAFPASWRVKRVLASEKKPGLELTFTHPVNEKTVSNSASRVQNIFK